MAKNKLIKPFLKWAGGKRQLLGEIHPLLPKKYHTYYEPFLGGGALLFDQQRDTFVINDFNEEVINVYNVIRNNVEDLIAELETYKNTPEFFYEKRELDRKPEFRKLTLTQKAARIIYLNKTCFNGLFRVNSQGQFNAPFGKYSNPDFINSVTLRAVSRYFNNSNGTIMSGDYAKALAGIKKSDFAYLDPPYDPVSDTSSFTGYTLDGFDRTEQERLRDECRMIDKKGAYFLLSNSSTDFIHDLYKDFNIKVVQANRNINSDGFGRGKIDEVLICNYDHHK